MCNELRASLDRGVYTQIYTGGDSELLLKIFANELSQTGAA